MSRLHNTYHLLSIVAMMACWRGVHGTPDCSNPLWINNSVELMDTQQQEHERILVDAFEGYSLNDIWEEYDCDAVVEDERPVHDKSTWMMLRTVYHSIVGASRATIPLSARHGFVVAHKVKYSEGRGRGVFAEEDIKKGQLVYSGEQQVAEFTSGSDYRRFLQSIPKDLACDVMMWAYVEDVAKHSAPNATTGIKDEKLSICVDLDEGSILNDADVEPNLGCDKEAAKLISSDCEVDYFALRDINKGEELFVVYADFDVADGWSTFGL